MKYVFLILLTVFSIVHLAASWTDNKKVRAATKPFLLIFIILFYVVSAENISIWLVLALATSWLGDVLLIPSGNKWFVAGGLSFLASHILFIITYATVIDFSKAKYPISIAAAVIYYTISVLIMKALVPTTPKPMIVPMGLYLICNSTMNVFALTMLTSLRTPGTITAYIGAVLFFISDCTLFIVRYYKKKDVIFKNHFTVMLTYILGEFLIALGMLQIQ